MSCIASLRSPYLELAFSAMTGGCLTHLRFFCAGEFVDLMRPGTAAAIEAHDPQGLACFVSLPYVSRIHQGHFAYEGVTYNVPPNQPPSPHPLHGIVWRRPAVITQHSSQDITIRHEINEPGFPFRFRSTQVWRLDDNVLTITLSQTNTGSIALPFGMGLHPFFRKSLDAQIRTGVKAMIRNNNDVLPVSCDPVPEDIDFTRCFRHLSDLPVDNCFTGWDRNCHIRWPGLGAELQMTASSTFGFFVLCSPPDTDWFCANPVSHFNDAYNNSIRHADTGLVRLAPGESMEGWIRLQFQQI